MKKFMSRIIECNTWQELSNKLQEHLQIIQNDGLEIIVEHVGYQAISTVCDGVWIYRYSVCVVWSAGLG
jgi:hypothetical protein